MNKKITRRAVLGTTIAALAAGPFVMRAMRKGQKDLPVDKDAAAFLERQEFLVNHGYTEANADFFEEWKAAYDKFDAQFEADSALGTVTLETDFSHSRNWHFRNLSTLLIEPVMSLSDCTPKNLCTFELIEGDISIDKGILDISVNIREHKFLDFVDKEAVRIVEKESDVANGLKSVTMMVDNPYRTTREIKTEQRETGRISFKDKDSNGFLRPVNSDGSERKVTFEMRYPFPIDYQMLILLLHTFPEHESLQVGSSFDSLEVNVANGSALPRYAIKSAGKISGVPAVMFSAEELTQTQIKTIRKTEDICVDIETGLVVCRKHCLCGALKETPADRKATGSSQISVFQIS